MSNAPLAHRARPQSFDDLVGQTHLVGKDGVLRRMVEKRAYASMIFYGNPGTGKTTIALLLAQAFGLQSATFNASTDTKAQLKAIIDEAKLYRVMIIVDEIHRMTKNIQDYLLPYVEDGTVIMVGLTTNNPYHSVNPAIRSRAHVFKLEPLKKADIVARLKTIHEKFADELDVQLENEVYAYLAQIANHDIRSAINALELCAKTASSKQITLENAEKLMQRPALDLDKDEDNYYNILSAFQKSIRGSDVDASLHYLARLIVMEDLDSILRRMSVITYEDIGLANPTLFPKMEACAQAALRVGFPEARIVLAAMVVELALSPKSNRAYLAIDKALKDIEAGKMGKIPNHLINIDNFESKAAYKYPHDFPEHIIAQQYLPDALHDAVYYDPAETSKYEKALKTRLEAVKKRLKPNK